jgi:hypothetical protein
LTGVVGFKIEISCCSLKFLEQWGCLFPLFPGLFELVCCTNLGGGLLETVPFDLLGLDPSRHAFLNTDDTGIATMNSASFTVFGCAGLLPSTLFHPFVVDDLSSLFDLLRVFAIAKNSSDNVHDVYNQEEIFTGDGDDDGPHTDLLNSDSRG